jgi:hypothetical protein
MNEPSADGRGRARVAHEPANFHYLIDPTARSGLGVVVRFTTDPQATRAALNTAVICLINRRGRLAARVLAGVPIDTNNLARDLGVPVATMNPAFNCPQRCADLREEAGCDQITRGLPARLRP